MAATGAAVLGPALPTFARLGFWTITMRLSRWIGGARTRGWSGRPRSSTCSRYR